MTVYDTIVSMGSESMHVPRMSCLHGVHVLLSLTTVKNVMVSMEDSYHWTGEVPAGRVKGRTIKWVSKSRGREELSIEWKLGIRDDGYVPGQVTYAAQKYRTCARSVL